jgi:AcrR family transcriptional regulator
VHILVGWSRSIVDDYHHGDLRSALVLAGMEVGRRGGVAALGVRDLTRAVGVSATAAYPHFASHRALILTISEAAQQEMSRRSILEAMTAAGSVASPTGQADARLRAFCLAYIGFAVAEPGWFELTCQAQKAPAHRDGRSSPPPHHLLLEALDALAAAGGWSLQQQIDAEWSCWSMAHGFALHATTGPLQSSPADRKSHLAHAVVNTLIAGLRSSQSNSHAGVL